MAKREPSDFKTKDCYKRYQEFVEKELQVDYATYMKVIKSFNEKLRDVILKESEEVVFPCNLGKLRVKKFKLNFERLKPDWQATKKLWETSEEAKKEKKLVYHLNEHRNGYAYRLYWNKKSCRVRNKTVYSFKPARSLSRGLAYILKNNNEIDYYL